MRRPDRFAISVSLLVSAACATPQPSTADRPRSDQSTITRQQIEEEHYTNAYDLVEALHSNWLKTRGVNSLQTREDTTRLRTPGPSQVLVYIDNSMVGGVSKLHEIALTSVSYIKYIDGRDATARWGLDHGSGVIFVSTHPASSDP